MDERPTPPRPRILLCVSGGIAAYKTPELVRGLIKAGLDVQVTMTPAASSFVTAMSLATVSGRPVRTSVLDVAEEGSVGHIELADWPDLVVVAPATADVMARAAAGMADDLVTTCLLATRAPVLWAPAMNTNMWKHAATQANVALLRSRGGRFVGPDAGELACGWTGEGRMVDPSHIVDTVLEQLKPSNPSWAGRTVVVSAGPTRAYLDPVRFITNASTGAMGFALAEVAAARGANVTLVAGPVQRATPAHVQRIDVETTEQMHRALDQAIEVQVPDLVAMVAAVSDIETTPATDKLPKSSLIRDFSSLSIHPATDILATLVRKYPSVFFLGFGAQTVNASASKADVQDALIQLGADKLHRKCCDALFVNRVGVAGVGFGSDTNTGVLVSRESTTGELWTLDAGPTRPKPELAAWLLDRVLDRLESSD